MVVEDPDELVFPEPVVLVEVDDVPEPVVEPVWLPVETEDPFVDVVEVVAVELFELDVSADVVAELMSVVAVLVDVPLISVIPVVPIVVTVDVVAVFEPIIPDVVFWKELDVLTRSKTWNWLLLDVSGETTDAALNMPPKDALPPTMLPPPSSLIRSNTIATF